MGEDGEAITLDHGWGQMEGGIEKLKLLLEGDDSGAYTREEFMALYTTIYNMCTQKPPYDYSDQLYARYREAFVKYTKDVVMPALQTHRDEYLLHELLKRWDNHKIMVRWLSRFFNYLDRYYVGRHQRNTLGEVGLMCFREDVYTHLHVRAKNALLMMIEKERDGDLIERSLLKNILSIFIEVGMGHMDQYKEHFEKFLLSETSDYYKRKAAAWIQADTCPEYLKKAEECLDQEEERVVNYLHSESKTSLLEKVEKEVLAEYETQLLEKENSGVAALLRDGKREDLARIYRLFARIPKGLDPVAEAFKRHVESEGLRLVKEASEAANQKKEAATTAGKPSRESGGSHEQQFVSSVIALHDEYLNYVQDCFANSSMFHKALKDAFESFCNKTVASSSSAELMATFCNNLLRKGGTEKLNEEETELQLEKVVKLLAYISDKDLFSEFYRKRLARRLLNDLSANDELERTVLSKLKQQCGAQFTAKMEGMVTDLQLAKDKHRHFNEWRQQKKKILSYDLVVNVLTTGFWPTYKGTDLQLPEEMTDGVQLFKEAYDDEGKGARKLSWIFALGSLTIKATFNPKVLELVVAPFQAAVLFLFNGSELELSYEEIKGRLALPDEDLSRALHSLSCAKYKVLNKTPASTRINKTDTFALNLDFTDKARRVKIPLPPQDEKKKVVEDVNKDRRHSVDAAIVRIMKSRKQLNHQNLVSEVVQQMSRMFNPDVRLIKKRIDDLILREYLERDKDASNIYKYVA